MKTLFYAGNTGVFRASSPHHGDGRHHQHLHHRYGFRPTKLFVFGDSYADTGNIQKTKGSSWKEPYGITFPGKPSGRFSDGRVLTDYVGNTTPFLYFLSILCFFSYLPLIIEEICCFLLLCM